MQRLRGRGTKADGPPVFSLEFIIQNHADIISCVCMVVFMMLIPQVTNPLASSLIFVHHNVTVNAPEPDREFSSVRLDTRPPPETYYAHGTSDLCNVVFYMLVWIIIHALLQEYIWERTVKRLHLSKVKTSKYYDSGCLVVFYLLSVVWGIDIIIKSGFATDPTQLWLDYPHNLMRLSLKFFMLNQMAFWLHCYPELFFMKTRKEEIYSKLVLYTSSILITAGAYLMMLQRVAVVLLVLHYAVEFVFHACRLLHYHGKTDLATPGFKLWQALFVLARVGTVFISVVTLGFGIGMKSTLEGEKGGEVREEMEVEVEGEEEEEVDGTVNITSLTSLDLTHWGFRVSGLVFVLLLQLWVAWTFLSSQWERVRGEEGGDIPKRTPKKTAEKKANKSKAGKPKTS